MSLSLSICDAAFLFFYLQTFGMKMVILCAFQCEEAVQEDWICQLGNTLFR